MPTDAGERLPVDFPTGQLVTATWFAVAVSIGTGLATFGGLRSPVAVVLAMLVVLAGTYLALAPYASLTLPVRAAAAVLATQVVLAVPDGRGRPHLRRARHPALALLPAGAGAGDPGAAAPALVGASPRWPRRETGIAWTSLTGGSGWSDVARAGTGHLLFLLMAVLITRVLRTINRRQARLRSQEDDAIDASVRQHVAVVQRALWVADLRAQSRAILVRLAAVDGPVPADLRHEALMLEATLRESLVARNVMSDELAVLTEAARRRGVEVRLVDSRHTVVPPDVAQALLDVVRRALAVPSVTRLVVRLAPEGGATAASVLTEDAARHAPRPGGSGGRGGGLGGGGARPLRGAVPFVRGFL